MSEDTYLQAPVSMAWLVERLDDPTVRIAEVDTAAPGNGHLRNAIG